MALHFVLLAAAAITAAQYPDADTVVLDDLTRVEYAADGTYVQTSEVSTRILTEKGRREEGVQSLHYSARYGKASFDEVTIESEDGARRTLDLAAAVGEATDNSSMSSNIYDPLDKRLLCRIPALKVGDTVTVKTTRRTFKSRVEGQFSDIGVLEYTSPIIHARYEVKSPKALPLACRARFRPAEGKYEERVETAADGSEVVIYEVRDVPQAFPEPSMPELWTELQQVIVSTIPDWPTLSKWYHELCRPHLEHTNAAMSNKVAELIRDLPTELERRDAIYHFVAKRIRYMGLTLEDTSPGYAPHDVSLTFDNRYGVCRDKAGLLVAMLRIAGFEAYPVLINVGPKMQPTVPQAFFNHAIVAVVEKDGSYALMDPTNENSKDPFPEYLANLSYLVARPDGDELRTTPVPSPELNLLRVTSNAQLDDDGAMLCHHTLDFNGINDTLYRGALAKLPRRRYREWFETRAKALSRGAELVDFKLTPEDVRDPSQALKLELTVRYPDMTLEGESQLELQLPLISRVFSVVEMMLGESAALEKRKYNFLVDTTAALSETFTLDLGDAVGESVFLPSPLDERGGFEFSSNYRIEGKKLIVNRREALSALEFTPAEYTTLRERLRLRAAADRQSPVFARNRARGADIRRRSRELNIDTRTAYSWTITNRVETEVLTYNGLKSAAEMRLSNNPLVSQYEILSATVSNRNGQVHQLSEREINVMDAPWVVGAPRYPASRLTVLALPGVEVGSVIRLEYVESVTNSPVPFFCPVYLNSTDPLDRYQVRVDDWQRAVTNAHWYRPERAVPDSLLWREPTIFAKGDFKDFAHRLAPCLDCPAVDFSELRNATPVEIRDWMHRQVRILGPSTFELPLDRHCTPPATVLSERYASRLDYIRTMVSLMRSAGHTADLVFVAANADDPRALRELELTRYPRPSIFSHPVCRVKTSEGLLAYVSTEDEYTPFGATAYENCDVFDPATCEFSRVAPMTEALALRPYCFHRYLLRENGALDYRERTEYTGVAAGAFRKRWIEILPEQRERAYLELLNGVAQGASATSPLVTATDTYPAVRDFECYVPDFAFVRDGVISVHTQFGAAGLPTIGSAPRSAPIELPAFSDSTEVFDFVFPRGYRTIEHLPPDFELRDPEDPSRLIYESRTRVTYDDVSCSVTVTRRSYATPARILPAAAASMVTEWRRRLTDRAATTVSVRASTSSGK